jgi:hypothetical protein
MANVPPRRPFFLFALVIHALVTPTVSVPQAMSADRRPFSRARAGFTLSVNNTVVPYRVSGLFVLPGERLSLQAAPPGAPVALRAAGGTAVRLAPHLWQWHAPHTPGLYPVQLSRPAKGAVTLNVFVMVPARRVRGGWLNGYRIGPYPPRPFPRRPALTDERPRGFVEVTRNNEGTLVAPHFALTQFLCKQTAKYPKYLVLKEQLLWKLEAVLERANQRGYQCDTLSVISGYRTPYYNHAIGNVTHSRHLWGDAADIFIDAHPRDGRMDDLNRDGVIDFRDAAALYELIDGLQRSAASPHFAGGLAPYRGTPSHGPFVHVDVRGHLARWNR